VLSLTAWNAVRAASALANWDILLDFASNPGPLYITISGSFWTLGGLAVLWAFLRRTRQARNRLLLYVFSFALWFWLDRLFLQAARPNWPFILAATVISLGVVAVFTFHPHTILYFTRRETHEPNSQDQTSS
jgi:hypothetical protein